MKTMRRARSYAAPRSAEPEYNLFDSESFLPERELLVAVLARAIADSNLSDRRIRFEARSWLRDYSHEPWGFAWVVSNLLSIQSHHGHLLASHAATDLQFPINGYAGMFEAINPPE